MDMTFVKWNSIENSYRTKEINYYRALHDDLDNVPYIITEKIHGANISIHFKENHGPMIARRNAFLSPNESFYGVWDVIEKYRGALDVMRDRADSSGDTIRLYGEIYGSSVQKGVDYGGEKRIAFFGMKINDDLVPFGAFLGLAPDGLPIVPVVGEVDSLQEALDFNTEFISLVGSSLCEGIVIQPRDVVIADTHGSLFLLKKKNEKFLEVSKEQKVKIVDEAVDSLQREIGDYVTKMRLLSIFSKEGEIERPNQIGDYIRFMMADVAEEFAKDYPEFTDMDKRQRGQVLKVVGKLTANLLRDYL